MKQKLLNFIIRNIFNGFTEYDVVTFNKASKMVFINGKQLTDQEVNSYKEEAHLIMQTQLWKLAESTLTKNAHDKLITNSVNWEDVYFGKAMLYNLSVIKNVIQIFIDLKK